MYSTDSPIMATSDIAPTQVDEWFHHYNPDAPSLGGVIVTEGARYGVDPVILAAQVAEETGYWTSDYAVNRNNPAGIGAVDTNPDDALTFPSIQAGVHAQVAHLLSYTLGNANPIWQDDPRWEAVKSAGHFGQVKTIGDLGNGVWATDPDYAGKIAARSKDLYNVPKGGTNMRGYGIQGNYTTDVRMDLENDAHSFPRGDETPQCIVYHVTDGESLDGALTWNRNPDVQASATFYVDKDGTAVQDVSLNRAPWANGIINNPSLPDWLNTLVQHGVNPNMVTIAIEHVGHPDDPDFPTDAQWKTSARLSADLCDAFQIPVDRDHLLPHSAFDSVNRANCPGPRFELDKMVRDVSELLNGPSNSDTTPTGVSTGTGDSRGDGTGVQSGTGSTDGGTSHSGDGSVAGDGGTTGAGNDAANKNTKSPTGFDIDESFRDFYGSEFNPAYGYAISPVVTLSHQSVRGGQPTTVQWTERARLESWTDADGNRQYSAGLLGYQDMERFIAAGVPVPGAYLGGAR